MKPKFTIAATSDIHINKYSLEKDFFTNVNDAADIFIIGGDINDGEDQEVENFLKLVEDVTVPIVIILGNHDCSSGNVDRIKETLQKNPLIKILDGEYVEYTLNGERVGIAGAKGFGGGFAPHRIVGRGEQVLQDFIAEENSEVEKLERAMAMMAIAAPEYKVALTHWAPFTEVIEGEALELYPMLGSSRLGDVISAAHPDIALSGHAHHGPKGIKKARGLVSACNIGYKVNDKKMLLFDVFSSEEITFRLL